jgi:hypothetical protein
VKQKIKTLFFLCIALGLFFGPLLAETVVDIAADGTLTLASGKHVTLAGILMDTEGISVLKAVAAKQDVRIEEISASALSARSFAYAFLETRFMKFPNLLGAAANTEEVMLNEFLIRTGAAKVDKNQEFAKKQDFLELQSEAKIKGEGIWSYEDS